jgi:hypothetical protein
MALLGLVGITDGNEADFNASVNPEGSLTTRLIGSDGLSQIAAMSATPQPSDIGIVIKSADLAEIKSLLVEILLELRSRQ